MIEHPCVAEAAVVGSPDEEGGEVVKAFVVLTQKYRNHNKHKLSKEIQDHVKTITAPYQYPRKVSIQ